MVIENSPYARVAANYRENGYHVMPIGPGTKWPGIFDGSRWSAMPGWAKHCDNPAPDFVHEKWQGWPDAGVCVAHGNIIGLDLDTDRKDVEESLRAAVALSDVRRRGQKGWMGYYRPGDGLDDVTARVRWYDPKVFTVGPDGKKSYSPVVELLLHGTQSVLPPTIHPDTEKPYTWLTPDTLESTDISDLPMFTGADLDAIDSEMEKIGLVRKAPRQSMGVDLVVSSGIADLEKPIGRSINDRAMEPTAIDMWWPAMGLPKTRQRGSGAWEAIADWRGSGSGRATVDRNPNLKITPTGIRDFGSDEPFTPIDLICRWKGTTNWKDAADWLEEYIRTEDLPDTADLIAKLAQKPVAKDDIEVKATSETFTYDMVSYDSPTLEELTKARAGAMPNVVDLADGVLLETFTYVRDAMRREWPEAAFMVALNVTGLCIGRNFATWTNLRSNLYTVILAGSGWGKSSIYNPAVDLLIQAGLADFVGSERIMSDSGLIQEIFATTDHKKIYFLDEFGHMLQRCNDRGAGGHVKKIVTEFTNLYSKAGGFYAGSAYADGSRQSSMHSPHVNIFGMATPGQFWEAFGSGSIEDGTLPRFSILKAEKRPKRKKPVAGHLALMDAARDRLAPKIRELAETKEVTGNLSAVKVKTVSPDADAEVAWQDIEDLAEDLAIEAEHKIPDKDFGGILARVAETAAKIALIFAVCRSPEDPKITLLDVTAGRRLAWWFAHVAIEGVMVHVSDNASEALKSKVLQFIKDGPDRTRVRWEVIRAVRVSAREIDDVLTTLEEAEYIIKARSTAIGRGRPSVTYTATENA